MKTKNRIKLAIILFFLSSPSFAVIFSDNLIVDDTSGSLMLDFGNQTHGLFAGVNELPPNLIDVISSYNAGDAIKAKDLISKILSKNPENPKALHVAGVIFMQEQRYKNAQVAFEVALRSEVKNPAILSKLGATRLLMGDRAEGQKILNLALELDPKNELALRYLAWLAETNNAYPSAAGYYTRLIEIVKPVDLSPLHIAQARALTRAGQYEQAAKVLAPLTKAKSSQNQAQHNMATALLIESYIQTGNFKAASSRLSKAQKNKQLEELQAAAFKIELSIKQKQFGTAQRLIKASIQKHPQSEHILRYAASQAFAKLGENKRAIDQLKNVVTFLETGQDKNKLFSAANDLAALYVSSDRKLDALRLLQKLTKKYPEELKLSYQLAELQTSAGQLSDAKLTLKKIQQQESDFMLAYYLKGIIARREKQHIDAEKWFSKVNQMAPHYEKAWVQRSGSAIDAGNTGKALEILALAVEKNEVSALLWFEYGALLSALNQHHEAILAYKTVLTLFPDHLPSIDNLAGELLVLEENPPEAFYYALKAVQMDPTDKVLQLNYLEALFQNNKYKDLLENANTLKAGFKNSGRFHYFVGASYLKDGNKEKGQMHLKLAAKDEALEDRYNKKVSKLLDK